MCPDFRRVTHTGGVTGAEPPFRPGLSNPWLDLVKKPAHPLNKCSIPKRANLPILKAECEGYVGALIFNYDACANPLTSFSTQAALGKGRNET